MHPDTQKVLEAFKIIMENFNYNFDQSKYGIVVEILPYHKYKIQIKDKIYEVKSLFNYSIDERVLVLFPCGNDRDLYIYPNKLHNI